MWLDCCVAPYLRLLKCVGQGVVDNSVVVISERNGKVIYDVANNQYRVCAPNARIQCADLTNVRLKSTARIQAP